MFALAAALLVSPACAPQPPGVEVIIEPQPPGSGFGYGGGFSGSSGWSQPIPLGISSKGETFLMGQTAGVLISPDGAKVWGWSAASGDLVPLPVDVPEAERGKIRPVLGQGVAMLVLDGVAYAFGGDSGEWGSHPIGDRRDATPIVGSNVGAIRTADGVWAYSGVTGTGGLHPLDAEERIDGPAVGGNYVRVASDRGFGLFSGRAGKWGSVRYEPPRQNAAPAGADPESMAPESGGQEGHGFSGPPADAPSPNPEAGGPEA